MSSVERTKRLHVVFSGRVQGVGFRYTVCNAAKDKSVTGFVRNVWSGDVELVAEGTEQQLHDLLQEIRSSRLKRNIMNEKISWSSATGEFKQFGIAF